MATVQLSLHPTQDTKQDPKPTSEDVLKKETASDKCDEALQNLRSTGHLAIYVADDSVPYQVPHSVIHSQNIKFLQNAIKYEHLGDGPPESLQLADDNPNAVKIFLSWLMVGHLPSIDREVKEEEVPTLVASWIMGDKYDVPLFQDLAMLELLKYAKNKNMHFKTVKFAFENTVPGAKLRKFMAEEVANAVKTTSGEIEKLKVFDGTPNFIVELVRAIQFLDEPGRATYKTDRLTTRRKHFMVCGGPKQHWVYASIKKSAYHT